MAPVGSFLTTKNPAHDCWRRKCSGKIVACNQMLWSAPAESRRSRSSGAGPIRSRLRWRLRRVSILSGYRLRASTIRHQVMRAARHAGARALSSQPARAVSRDVCPGVADVRKHAPQEASASRANDLDRAVAARATGGGLRLPADMLQTSRGPRTVGSVSEWAASRARRSRHYASICRRSTSSNRRRFVAATSHS